MNSNFVLLNFFVILTRSKQNKNKTMSEFYLIVFLALLLDIALINQDEKELSISMGF